VFYRAPLGREQQALLERLEKAAQDHLANLVVSRADLAGGLSEPLRSVWETQEKPALPWMVVRYPRPTGIALPAWAGPPTAEAVESLLESPARRDIVQRLLNGDAVVWLLLGSGDPKRDDQVAKLVEVESRRLEQSLVLPERSPNDPPINPDLPLKIAFSTVRLPRTNPAERVLVNMLLNWNTNLTASTEAMLFPIFGRGRVVPPAIGTEIRAEAIRDMAEFLSGPCSCEVKEMNPGYDLLLTANWSSLSGYQEVMIPEPPPLVGMSQFATAAAATTNPAPRSPQRNVLPATQGTVSVPANHDPLTRNLLVALGFMIVSLVATTFVIKAKAGRRSR